MQLLLNVLGYVQICVVNENVLHENINVYVNHMNMIQILERYIYQFKKHFQDLQLFFL